MNDMKTPVMICGFTRPDTLGKVFAAVREAKPKKLYLVLDAPREGRPGDVAPNEECKRIFEGVDWPCDVVRDYATINMGCGKRMTSAITNVFDHEETAIILEDDCVPHPSFFRFCEELLERYKDDTRVGMIAAACEHFRKDQMDFHGDSYYFDRMSTTGAGWATWRRAWRLHDPSLKTVPRMIECNVTENIFPKRSQARRWAREIMTLYDGTRNTWAGAWATTLYRENFLVAHSVANPVINIGQGKSSRPGADGDAFPLPVDFVKEPEEIAFPLRHPVSMIPNVKCERYYIEDSLYTPVWRKLIANPRLAVKKAWKKLFCRRAK